MADRFHALCLRFFFIGRRSNRKMNVPVVTKEHSIISTASKRAGGATIPLEMHKRQWFDRIS